MARRKGRASRPGRKIEKARPWKDIGRRLAQARAALEIKTQTEFASKAGLSQNNYNPFETGEREITLEAALKLKDTYDISLDYIYRGDKRGLPHGLLSALAAGSIALKAS